MAICFKMLRAPYLSTGYLDHGGTIPFMRAYATNCPMCSLSWMMIRRYMPSTGTVLPSILTLRSRSPGLSWARAVFTAASERFSQSITSAFFCHCFLQIVRLQIRRQLRHGETQQFVIRERDVHDDLAHRPHTRRR